MADHSIRDTHLHTRAVGHGSVVVVVVVGACVVVGAAVVVGGAADAVVVRGASVASSVVAGASDAVSVCGASVVVAEPSATHEQKLQPLASRP